MARIRTVRDNVRLGQAQPMAGVGMGMPGVGMAGMPALGMPAAGMPAAGMPAAGGVPPAGLPVVVGQPPPAGQPALALEDNGPAAAPPVNLSDEAMKAINKINSEAAQGPGLQANAQMPPANAANGGQEAAAGMANTEDKRLQDEALKAIQQLNA